MVNQVPQSNCKTLRLNNHLWCCTCSNCIEFWEVIAAKIDECHWSFSVQQIISLPSIVAFLSILQFDRALDSPQYGMESGVACCQTLSASLRIEVVDGSGNKNGTRHRVLACETCTSQCHVEQPGLQTRSYYLSIRLTIHRILRALYSPITALASGLH